MPNGLFGPATSLPLMLMQQQQEKEKENARVTRPSEEETPQQGFFGKLGNIFAGQPNPMLSEEQNKQARDQALTMAGLQMLMQSGGAPGVPAPNLLQILAGGAAQGQQAGAAAGQQIMSQDAQMQMQQIMQDPSLSQEDKLNQAFNLAFTSGDVDSMRAISEILKSMKPGAAGKIFEATIDGRDVFIQQDPSGAFAEVPGGFAPQAGAEPKKPSLTAAWSPTVGEVFVREDDTFGFVDALGKPVPDAVPIAARPKQEAVPTVLEKGLATAIRNDLKLLEGREDVPAYLFWLFNRTEAARSLVSDEDQIYLSAIERISADIIRLMSGAQASEKEVARVSRSFLPAPGEKAGSIRVKLNFIKLLADSLTEGMGEEAADAAVNAAITATTGAAELDVDLAAEVAKRGENKYKF